MKLGTFEVSNTNQKIILTFFLAWFPDFISIICSAFFAYYFRFANLSQTQKLRPSIVGFGYIEILVLLVFSWTIFLFLSGCYKFDLRNLATFDLRLIVKRSISFFFLLGFLSFLLKASFSRFVFLLMLTSGIFFILCFRIVVYFFVVRPLILRKRLTTNLMIVGSDINDINDHTDWLIRNRTLGFTIASRLVCPEISSTWIKEFDKLLRYKKITEVLLLPGMEADPNFAKFIHYCEDFNIHVNWIPLDSGNLGYWLIPSPQEGIPFLTFERPEISLPWRVAKRAFDLVFSITIMIVFSPVFIAIGIAVLVSSGWPIFYSQKRVGLNGRTFRFYKFRSMIKYADKIVEEVENIHAYDHVLFKNRQDPRVTPVGRFLRKYSLDELPQFLNVINNSMSVVGPRPALPSEVSVYNSIYERRLIAKPGITGPWQISGRSDLDLRTSVALDLNYLINWSFTKDLWIILSTIGAVFKGRGAY